MKLEELNVNILNLLKSNWNRVIALDMETHVEGPDKFLTDERILCVSYARRRSGKFMEDGEDKMLVKTIFLDGESDESEDELLEKLDEELSDIKPLGVIGYLIRQYDIPLLIIKKERYGKRHNKTLWRLVDVTESAAIVDLYHLLKYKGYGRLEEAFSSQEFSRLPLRRTKQPVPGDREEKPREIYRERYRLEIYKLWRDDRETLRKYIEGEVHDFLIIAEYLAFGGGYHGRQEQRSRGI